MNYLIENYIVDKWSIIHIVVWGLVAGHILKRVRLSTAECVLWGLVSAYWWELLEWSVISIYQVPFDEPFLNRFVFDPIFDMIGVMGAVFVKSRKNAK